MGSGKPLRWLATTLLLLANFAEAENARAPLQLEDVLQSSSQHFPTIAIAMQRIAAEQGERQAAFGGFDTVISSDNRARLSGFYDGQVSDNRVARPFANNGGSLYGAYRLSDGQFPIYEDQLATLSRGEVKLGIAVSLLRDREIDERRRALSDAEARINIAEQDLLATRLNVQARAMASYFMWLARGEQAQIYANLLGIAREREVALERRVAEGDAAEILLVENRENLLRREVLLVDAERAFDDAAARLSLFWRDLRGQTQLARREDLGAEFPETDPADANQLVLDNVAALERRPELQTLEQRRALAGNALAIARNDLKPRLDAFYEVANDFGSGSPSRDGTDNVVGLTFSVPLERRFARGKIARAQAELRAIDYEQQLIQDQLIIELRTIANALEAAAKQVELAKQEVEQARAMERAEQLRFERGASDFFLVNLREERTANARIRVLDAQLTYTQARAELLAATVALSAMGVGAPSP